MASNNPELFITSGIFDNLKEKIEEVFASTGLGGVSSFLGDLMNEWKSVQMRIAIIGNTKSGKSSFINTIRNLKPEDKGAAKVGCTEVMIKIEEYHSPENPNLIYVDVPGVGTPQFPQETYLKEIDVDKYDFYIIMSANTFTENDLWLAKELKNKGKSFLMVRTHIDHSLKRQKKDYPSTYNEEDVLNTIKGVYKGNLKGIEENHIYLISNRLQHTSRWDFPKLRETLVRDFPKTKHDALLLSLRSTVGDTKKLILLKKNALQRRAKLLSFSLAFTLHLPNPEDVSMMAAESELYRCHLGLDSESILRMSDDWPGIVSVTLENIASLASKYSADAIMLKIYTQFKTEVIAECVLKCIPLIGLIPGVAIGYVVIMKIMSQMLDDYTTIALDINTYIYERVASRRCSNQPAPEAEDSNSSHLKTDHAIGDSSTVQYGNSKGTVVETNDPEN